MFMKCECYNVLKNIEDKLNSEGNFSYAYLDSLKYNGELDNLLDSYNVSNMFEDVLNSFLNILFDKSYDFFPNLKKILLHEADFVSLFRRFGYILSLYMDNKDAYRVFPLFLYSACLKYNVSIGDITVSNMSDLLVKNMDLSFFYNPNLERDLIEINMKPVGFYTDYSKYDEILSSNKIYYEDQTLFFVSTEYSVYLFELSELKKYPMYNADFIVRWVSRYHGDGYGFDVLSFDPTSMREKLIEVKSGKSKNITVTKEELKKIYKCIYDKNCDYYIYKCYFNKLSSELEYYVLKLDLENRYFVDVHRGDKYLISPYFYFKDGKQKVEASIEREDLYVKVKNL